MFKKMPSSLGIPSLGLPRTRSLQETLSSMNKKRKGSLTNYKSIKTSTIPLDKHLTNEGHKYIASYLKFTQIQNYILKGSLHKVTDKDVDDLIKSYDGITTPVYDNLTFQDLNLSYNECKVISKLLKADKVTNIRSLRLGRNHLFGSSVKILLEALQKNTTVEILDLSFNHLTDNEAKWIGKLLKRNNTIREIYLNSNRIGSDGAKHLSKALMINNSVERLSLESNQLNSLGGIHMAEMLKVNNKLTYIHLGSNNLQLEGIKNISDSLKVNDTLTSLSLDINNILAEGAKSLGESLEVNQTLTHLYIPRNNIGSEGLKYICQSLRQNSTLVYIDLEFSGINSSDDNIEGVKELGELLENHNIPKAINLTQNNIGDEGCQEIFKGFHKNNSLESIILSHCSIGLDGVQAIAESLRLNIGLQNISLNKNPSMGVDGHKVLADALEFNTSLKGVQLDYNFAEWETIGNSVQQSLTRNHFLQKEIYHTACNILKSSRVLLNPILSQQLPLSCSTSPLMSPVMSPMMSPIMSPSMAPLMSPLMNPPLITSPMLSPPPSPKRQSIKSSKKKKIFTKLPFEIQEHIISYLDTKNVLNDEQILNIVNFSMKKSTLDSTKEQFLFKALSYYYPLTSDVKLWPTESTDQEFSSSDRI
uniref:Protein NLRC3 n=1 Tax=Anthurium amnicola TaxID=1678845 RepID=A0A1D1XX56_9ARAE